MAQKHHEAFYSKFPLAIKIFTGSPGTLSESDLLKQDRSWGQENMRASAMLMMSV